MTKYIHVHIHRRVADRKTKEAHEAAPAKDSRSKADIKREMDELEKKMDVIWRAGGQVSSSNPLQVKYKELQKELSSAADSSAQSDLQDEIDEACEQIEKLQDRGVTVPPALTARLKKLQDELKKLSSSKDASSEKEIEEARSQAGRFKKYSTWLNRVWKKYPRASVSSRSFDYSRAKMSLPDGTVVGELDRDNPDGIVK